MTRSRPPPATPLHDAAASGAEGTDANQGDLDGKEPIKSVTTGVYVEGDPKANMTIDMLEAHREGKFVKVTYGYTLHTTEEGDFNLWKVGGRDEGVAEYAIDQKNLNKHNPLNTNALTNSRVQLVPGQRVLATTVFAAPPEDVDKMDIYMWKGVDMAQGVEID